TNEGSTGRGLRSYFHQKNSTLSTACASFLLAYIKNMLIIRIYTHCQSDHFFLRNTIMTTTATYKHTHAAFKKNQRGFSLAESGLVLALGVFASAIAFIFFSHAKTEIEVTKERDSMTSAAGKIEMANISDTDFPKAALTFIPDHYAVA